MDCNEKATYIQTIIHCIKRTLENKSADQELKSQSAGLLNRGKHDNIRERIELLTQDPRSKSPLLIHGLGIIVCLVFMISSYCFILQPEYLHQMQMKMENLYSDQKILPSSKKQSSIWKAERNWLKKTISTKRLSENR